MDRVVSTIGKKNNCTFCGVFRRQALDRGATTLGVDHIVTGHNADDIAETVPIHSTLVLVYTENLTSAGSQTRRHHASRSMDVPRSAHSERTRYSGVQALPKRA